MKRLSACLKFGQMCCKYSITAGGSTQDAVYTLTLLLADFKLTGCILPCTILDCTDTALTEQDGNALSFIVVKHTATLGYMPNERIFSGTPWNRKTTESKKVVVHLIMGSHMITVITFEKTTSTILKDIFIFLCYIPHFGTMTIHFPENPRKPHKVSLTVGWPVMRRECIWVSVNTTPTPTWPHCVARIEIISVHYTNMAGPQSNLSGVM